MKLVQLEGQMTEMISQALAQTNISNPDRLWNMKVGVSYKDPLTGHNVLRDIESVELAVYRDGPTDTPVTWLVLKPTPEEST